MHRLNCFIGKVVLYSKYALIKVYVKVTMKHYKFLLTQFLSIGSKQKLLACTFVLQLNQKLTIQF